jgi:hypothetical protein
MDPQGTTDESIQQPGPPQREPSKLMIAGLVVALLLIGVVMRPKGSGEPPPEVVEVEQTAPSSHSHSAAPPSTESTPKSKVESPPLVKAPTPVEKARPPKVVKKEPTALTADDLIASTFTGTATNVKALVRRTNTTLVLRLRFYPDGTADDGYGVPHRLAWRIEDDKLLMRCPYLVDGVVKYDDDSSTWRAEVDLTTLEGTMYYGGPAPFRMRRTGAAPPLPPAKAKAAAPKPKTAAVQSKPAPAAKGEGNRVIVHPRFVSSKGVRPERNQQNLQRLSTGAGLTGPLKSGDSLEYAMTLKQEQWKDVFYSRQYGRDYFKYVREPSIFVWDLGEEKVVTGVVFWHYVPNFKNLVRTVQLRTNSEAKGAKSFSGPGVKFDVPMAAKPKTPPPTPPVHITVDPVRARYIEMSFLSNYGGDRVGLGDFAIVVEDK